MNLVRWQPRSLRRFGDTDDVRSEVDRWFDWALGSIEPNWTRPMVPALDISEEENRYVVRADLPGLSKDDIEITYQDGVVTLKGERKGSEKTENGRVYCHERFEGKFGRNLQLPQKIDTEKIEASFKDGVLELILPFAPEAQPRRIQIAS